MKTDDVASQTVKRYIVLREPGKGAFIYDALEGNIIDDFNILSEQTKRDYEAELRAMYQVISY